MCKRRFKKVKNYLSNYLNIPHKTKVVPWTDLAISKALDFE